MLLNSVIIVLREVLEAALMGSILLALTRHHKMRARWLLVAIPAGLAGAAAYGYQLGRISDLFDGVGQEVVNAGLQYVVSLALLVCLFLVARSSRPSSPPPKFLAGSMAAAVVVAIAREGSEIAIYIAGFMQADNFFVNIGVGSMIGLCIGLSGGVLLYYFLLAQAASRTRPVLLSLLGLVGAGMCAQATRLLIQADWIGARGALWDTSSILSERSIAGQLLYAAVGYEASPSLIEVVIYLTFLLLMGFAYLAGRHVSRDRATFST